MLNRVLFILLLSLSMVSNALADIKRVAVLEFRGVDVDTAILLKLSDQSRTAAVEILSKDEYLIMTRENMLEILSDMGKDASCMEGQCEVEVGRNVGADFIVTGDILKIEGTYVLTLKLYDTTSGGLLNSVDVEDTSMLSLKGKAHKQSITLFQKGLGLSGSRTSNASVNIEIAMDASGAGPVIKGVDYTAKLIPSGTFTMGCTSEQSGCAGDETPIHKVTLTRDFYMMESEVTQELYQRVMGNNPSRFRGVNRPVEKVSWFDAVKFANKLSSMEELEQCYTINGNTVSWSNTSCTGWRLPTEAEWEYASRGGQSYKYACSNSVGDVAWYSGNSIGQTHDVCGKSRNGYGLCDMSGNVYEWVWDWFGDYSSVGQTDPRGPDSGSYRVIRGGSWFNFARRTRVSYRSNNDGTDRDNFLGFRLSRIAP